ncbi:hypothetical protein FRC07_013451 [Ceratobasidium sp. 392]|nr:hypothetical protein FRC07_013451 [Ceratobasidium sp. 392]
MYYAAMLRYKFSDDTYHGQQAQPLLIPSQIVPMFEEQALSAAPELSKVWKAIEGYQQSNPPEQEPHGSDPELFKLFDFEKKGLEYFIKLPKLPDSYIRWLDPTFISKTTNNTTDTNLCYTVGDQLWDTVEVSTVSYSVV